MNNDPLSPILDQLYPGARVHHGFLDQFQAVTDKAANNTENIRHAAGLSVVLAQRIRSQPRQAGDEQLFLAGSAVQYTQVSEGVSKAPLYFQPEDLKRDKWIAGVC